MATGPVDSTIAFQNFHMIWRVAGRNPPQNHPGLYLAYSVVLNMIVTICIPVLVLAEVLRFQDTEALMQDMVFYVEILVTSLKFFTLWYYTDKFEIANGLLLILDKNTKSDWERAVVRQIIAKANRIFTTYFWITSVVLLWSIFGALFAKERQLLCAIWLPFDWRLSRGWFWLAFTYETLGLYLLICISVPNDCYAPMYLMILNGHFQNLVSRIESIGNKNQTGDQAKKELIECIRLHEIITEISNIIAPAISKTLFLQFLIAALALGISVVNIVYFIDDLFKAGKFLTLVFVIFLHMFPCCYYGNKYSENNGKILNALYSCHWINQDEKFKKTLIIFMEFNHATRYFWAGKIIPINLATFVSITKFAYTLVTFLNNMKN
ncbi:unnamed protein product [Hermetia illucens]|uniref:Odorant receptor n=1 Tax=Hermetia illucens TaxID=343691 RepID=A0A7R8UUQ0_HERIL|nr:odorant receptor 33a-like [Hermetia illucens]CAD7086938.1 unnamed protein product [Hermetia illucens]